MVAFKRRRMCPPHPDQLSLFQGLSMDSDTIQRVSFQKWNKQPKRSSSFRKKEKYCTPSIPFVGESQKKSDYKPVLDNEIAQIHQDVVARAAETANIYHGAIQTTNDANRQTTITRPVNQTDYFQFHTLKPRIRYGDRFERLRHEYPHRTEKWSLVTDNQIRFMTPLCGKRAEICKPLDSRSSQNDAEKEKVPFCGKTSYNDHYPIKQLPERDICPAELLLLLGNDIQ